MFVLDIYVVCEIVWCVGVVDDLFFWIDVVVFDVCLLDLIDYVVMECFVEYGEFGIEGIVVLFVVGWLDVGMWDVIWEIMLKDDDGNVVCGLIVFEDM